MLQHFIFLMAHVPPYQEAGPYHRKVSISEASCYHNGALRCYPSPGAHSAPSLGLYDATQARWESLKAFWKEAYDQALAEDVMISPSCPASLKQSFPRKFASA